MNEDMQAAIARRQREIATNEKRLEDAAAERQARRKRMLPIVQQLVRESGRPFQVNVHDNGFSVRKVGGFFFSGHYGSDVDYYSQVRHNPRDSDGSSDPFRIGEQEALAYFREDLIEASARWVDDAPVADSSSGCALILGLPLGLAIMGSILLTSIRLGG